MSTLSIATSGLSAASSRLNVAASNIANVLTTGALPATGGAGASSSASGSSNLPAVYVPLQVNQVAQSGGSTQGGTVSTVSPGFVAQSDPDAPFANQDGLVTAPDVDPAGEFAQMVTAKYAFAANAKVIQAASDMTKSLLDITA